jgi:hypothetical protein
MSKYCPLLLALLTVLSCAPERDQVHEVTSPDSLITLSVAVQDGKPTYSVRYGGEEIIERSGLGYDSLNHFALDRDFEVSSVKRRSRDSTWSPLYGTSSTIRDHHNQLMMDLTQTGGEERRLQILFRVFNDGVAFRYVLPEQDALQQATIYDEGTEFNFGQNHKTYVFRRPPEGFYGRPSGGEGSSYEGVYRPDSLATLDPDEIVAMPLLVDAEQAWVAISEANLTDYAGLYLQPREQTGNFTPAPGVRAYGPEQKLHRDWPGGLEGQGHAPAAVALARAHDSRESGEADRVRPDSEPERAYHTERHLVDSTRPRGMALVERTVHVRPHHSERADQRSHAEAVH